ncbi:hypothetical protein TNCV_3324331 [Trichonephila clavipes]|nr:hypothetical protein TNCV_3324331 [Trichonephila clavipes]
MPRQRGFAMPSVLGIVSAVAQKALDRFDALYGLVESRDKASHVPIPIPLGYLQKRCLNGHNVTVNGDRYRAMIINFIIPELNNHDIQELWFQQDGATCHTARATID